jgi:hypothetical protein
MAQWYNFPTKCIADRFKPFCHKIDSFRFRFRHLNLRQHKQQVINKNDFESGNVKLRLIQNIIGVFFR